MAWEKGQDESGAETPKGFLSSLKKEKEKKWCYPNIDILPSNLAVVCQSLGVVACSWMLNLFQKTALQSLIIVLCDNSSHDLICHNPYPKLGDLK